MYTILNVLIVTKSASYVATQISGETADDAWRNAAQWVARCNESAASYNIDTASPVFIKQDDFDLEQRTVGSCVRKVAAL